MAYSFTNRVGRWLEESHKRRHPWPIISAGQHCRKYIDRGTQPKSFMAAMLPVAAQWQERTAGFKGMRIGGVIALFILYPS